MMSKFVTDLSKEEILSEYLEKIYEYKGLTFKRNKKLDKQIKGIDLEIFHKNKTHYIDEKSQLHYLNKSLPTFTFELSYLKYGSLKKGWLFDSSKVTNFYFLITGIFLKSGKNELSHVDDLKRLKITSVNRFKLIEHLESKSLNECALNEYDSSCRSNNLFGKNKINKLCPKTEGLVYYTEHLSEKPINLQLRLNYLVKVGVAKVFYEG